jgi:YggT family protein
LIEISLIDVATRAVNTVMTLYMMLIIIRWLSPYLQLDLYSRRLKWIRQMTDPLIDAIRKRLPSMGPFDFAPLVALFAVWLVRSIAVAVMAGA